MGQGNWRPYRDSDLYNLRYFDLQSRYECELSEEDCGTYLWELFEAEIGRALPESFYRVDDPKVVPVPINHYSLERNNRIIFRNELVCIMIDASASADHVGVAMVILENHEFRRSETWLDNFAPKYMERCAPKLWNVLGGEQRVRESAWTSSVA